MKRRKLLSTAVAGTLVAAQLVMPVMAADGGEVDVDVTTKTAVIRVVVPTTLEVAVNQFEKDDAGSQIYSGNFTLQNKSEIPVKVDVNSEATLDSTKVTLLSSKEAAANSEADEAWLAVAAQVEAGKYITGDGKGIKDLTEASDNVTTFVQGTEDATKNTATAGQVFYLAAEDSPSVTYTKVAPTDADTLAAAKKISYAQFYELTTATYADDDAVQAAVDAGDICAIDKSSNAVSVIKKGTTGVTKDANADYYTIAADSTLAKDLAQGKVYIYGEAGAAATGGDAAFRYIGKLSESKETWSKDEISHIKIKYDITGITGTKFGEVKDDCVYGLYAAENAPITLSTTGLITMTASSDSIQSLAVNDGTDDYPMNSTRGTWVVFDENSDVQKFQLADEWVEYLKGKSAKAILTLNDGSSIESAVVAFPE